MDADMIDMLWYVGVMVALLTAIIGFYLAITATDDD